MSLTEEQYERIALWLDGRDVTLDEAERAAADQIRRDEAMLGRRLGAEAPPQALRRAANRMTAELARPRRQTIWVGRFAAAAAAAVLIALIIWTSPKDRTDPPVGQQMVPIEVVLDEMQNAAEAGAIDLVADELDALESEIVATLDQDVADLEIRAIESDIEDVLSENAASWPVEEDFPS